MTHADFRGTPTYFVVFKMIISSKYVNQNMFKNSLFFEKICTNSPSSGGSASRSQLASAPRLPSPCDLTHIYCNGTKHSKFVALFNAGFKGEILEETFFLENTLCIWKYLVLNIREDSPHPQTVLFPYGYDSATSPSKKFFLRKLVKFGQNWLDLCEI